jgi:sugar phosphate isomerase/epimerase
MPWPELLQAADDVGVKWYIAEQDNPRDAFEDVQGSLRYMQEMSKG